MRAAIVCTIEQLSAVAYLAAQLEEAGASPELWILGGLACFSPESTGVHRIFEVIAEDNALFSEPLCTAQALYGLFGDDVPQLVVTPADISGTETAAQLSILLDCGCAQNVSSLHIEGSVAAVTRAVFAGNISAEFLCGFPLCISLCPGGRAAAPAVGCTLVTLKTPVTPPQWIASPVFSPLEGKNPLTGAERVIAVGRGASKAADLSALRELASATGAELGGTRPLICGGKLPADRLIGMSGSRVSPKLCMVFGASGSGAFMAGLTGSELVIAVNRDADAPIFGLCDCGVVADCGGFARALLKKLEQT